MKKGYSIQHTWTDDILNMTTSSLSLEVSSLEYMDDANWISNSKENLEDILSIADEFYGFTRAAINKNKSQLITNSSGCPSPVSLKFGTSILNLPPERSSIHFLGIWININNSSTFVKQQYMDTIRSFTSILKKKPLTDKQICYITNIVLFSLLEYRPQTTPLSKNECNRMSSPIRTLIKNNSHFAISAPNCLFTGNVFYQLRDLWNQQLQSFSTALLYQFNSNSLYHQISRIRLFQLQSNEGLHVSPLACWNRPYDNKSYKNLIGAMISLLKHDCIDINFKLNNTLLNRIKGGSLPLDSILTSTQLAQSMIMIKKYKLLFLDQFLATDGFSLLSWVEIISRSCYSTISLPSPKLPKIYNLVSSLVLDNPNNNIVKNIFRLTSNNLFFSPSLDVDINSKKREFVSVLHAQSDRPITGRVLRKYSADNSLACQHLVLAPRNNQILPQHVERSIVPCDGCDLNDLQLLDFLKRPRYKKGSPPLKSITCVQSCDPAHTIIIKKAKTPHPNKGTSIMTQSLKEIA